jgi:ACS family hexuronate transporter-like MFS transporter
LFVFWIPIYLSEVFGMDVKQIGIYGWVPYVGAMFGAWFGGGLAQWLMTKGWSLNATRKSVISLGCLIMLPSFLLMSDPGTPFNAVMIMAVILFGFQTAIGSVQTLPSDLFGGKPVGTLAGIAGMSAKLGAAALTSLVPWLTAGGNYTPAFVIGAALAITAMMSILVLCPKVERLEGSH